MRTPVPSVKVTRWGGRLRGAFVGGEADAEESDFVAGEGAWRVLGEGLDGVDLADGVDGDGAVADGEFHGAGDDGAAGLGGGGAGGGFDLGEDGVDAWGGGFADAEFAQGGPDVILEGSAVGVERGGRSPAVGDQRLEALLPQIEEMVDPVQCSEFAGAAGVGAVLKFLEEGAFGGGLGLAVGGDRAEVAVVVSEPGL
jgi:hypothetical protein